MWRSCLRAFDPICSFTDANGLLSEPCIGDPQNCGAKCTVEGGYLMQLVAKVGTGAPFLLGNAATFAVTPGALVRFGANDWGKPACNGDNTGSISISVTWS
eukprot:TRINITY_DN4433_c0_g1_i1.p3 TRINITY_DN4433_c0_g1~~TRINITY_DN4433_c0_g1_i1.p3  ORF type:complete len:101 (+),score=23.24 TRINITY_DN4433_c0_g1_i1:293-595(+)